MSTTDVDFWIFSAVVFFGCLVSWGAIAYDSWQKEKERAARNAQIDGLLNSLQALNLTPPEKERQEKKKP